MLRLIIITIFITALMVPMKLLGQSGQYTLPEKLPATVNTNLEETLPILSPGGDTLYFTRFNLNDNAQPVKGHDIWYSIKENGTWSPAKNDLLNLEKFNSVVGIGANGQTLYLLKYEGNEISSSASIEYSEKIDGNWQDPQPWNVPEIFTANSFFGFSLNKAETVLIISMKGINTIGKEDLYISFKNVDQTWSTPRHMGPVVNSRGFEISPFLSSDNKTLYFSSNGRGGLGDADIFETHRLDDSWYNWSEPKNLGKTINSRKFDGYFARYSDDEIYLVSNRSGSFSDIYHATWLSEDKLKEMLANNANNGNSGKDGTGEKNGSGINSENGDGEGNLGDSGNNFGTSNDSLDHRITGAVIYFDLDVADLSPTARLDLLNVIDSLKDKKNYQVDLVGYTDEAGSQRYNLKLSKKRAKAARDFLVEHGLDKSMIAEEGKGIYTEISGDMSEAKRRYQRRVDIKYQILEDR